MKYKITLKSQKINKTVIFSGTCKNNEVVNFQKQSPRGVLLKKTLAQMFSCEFGEIFKNTFFIEHLRVTASGFKSKKQNKTNKKINKQTNKAIN